ncbi:zinc metalloprotease [Spongiivirga citrea]|uniref:Zinc metalloprotease n=1 Tax=Spongiivirga citrea TaxID=1481457 RepID=A0A6M0CMJ0_9FLAO|nr:zinc metalloprotease [Spongiivirga citrea]NER17049.1 zinc metalloprotease [Spongiivirga citrea]
MRPLLVVLPMLFIILVSCDNVKKKNGTVRHVKNDTNSISRKCATMKVLEEHLAKDSLFRKRMQNIEEATQRYITLSKTQTNLAEDTITIPVVVNVIYSNEDQNISDAQIKSQIDVLNKDFSKKNMDIDQIPEEFKEIASNIKVQFDLRQTQRKLSTRNSWGTNDEMKFSSSGGIDVADPTGHLNIWVCNIGSGILGYAQFPGDNPLTDGVVVSPQFFGTTGFVQAPFDKGRTLTHEIGHWLNLRHIWGDGDCNSDDFVSDTPISDRPNNGCPAYPTINCETNDMTMNYMDYVDDACMFMFTEGQKTRMRAVFEADGPRASFVQKMN